MGFQLFVRERSGLRPTAEAELLNEAVVKALASFELVRETALDIKNRTAGKLRVAALPVYADGIVPYYLAGFVDQYPNIKIQLFSSSKAEIENLVMSGQADIGISTLPLKSKEVVVEASLERSVVCVFPNTCPLQSESIVDTEMLQQHRVIHLVKGSPLRSLVETRFADSGVNLSVNMEVDTQRAIVSLVAAGAGIGIVDCDAISEPDRNLVTSRPLSPTISSNLAIVRSPKTGMSENCVPIRRVGHQLDLNRNTAHDVWTYL